MKKKSFDFNVLHSTVFLSLGLAIGVTAMVLNQNNTTNVLGANVVGTEMSEVCWPTAQAAEEFQVYYGQKSTGVKDSAIYGLSNTSRCLKLSHLKPCTSYVWNVNRKNVGKWEWQWAKDQEFMTGGSCENIPQTGNTTAKIVGTAKATVSWSAMNNVNKYYIYYRAAGDAQWTHAVEIPANSTSYTINYLDGTQSYMYRVAALINGKLMWMPEGNLNVVN